MIKLLILIILIYCYFLYKRKDGFTILDEDSFVKMENAIMDEFYAKNYDELYDTIPIHKKELKMIYPYLQSENRVLCLSCRSGHIVQLCSGICQVEGMESSSDMIELCEEKYPHLTFKYGYMNNVHLYPANSFTHIISPCLNIHLQNDLSTFFKNTYHWLIHNGYLFISYFKEIQDVYYMINHHPSFPFENKYKFSIEINRLYGDSTMVELIHENKHIKRKNIWNYKHINTNILNYEAKQNGFEYVNHHENEKIQLVVFRKKF